MLFDICCLIVDFSVQLVAYRQQLAVYTHEKADYGSEKHKNKLLQGCKGPMFFRGAMFQACSGLNSA